MARDPVVEQLLTILDRAYDRRSWHGTNLRGSIRGLPASVASFRPAPNRHNIWEIAVHAAYWKYTGWRRLTGARRGSFPLKGSNWFTRPAVSDDKAWREDVRLLDRMHQLLRNEIHGLSSRDLARTPARSAFSNGDLIAGIAAHDLYHAGQIQLLKRLAK
jgi:hypothetical protein